VYRALSMGALGHKVPFGEEVRLAAKYGFQGVSVGMAQVEEYGVDGLRRLLEKNGLLAAYTGVPVNYREDDATFEADLAKLPQFAETMSALGCTRTITWITPWHPTLSYKERFNQLRDRTARICEVLAPHGMRYGLEFIGPTTSRRDKPNPFIYDLVGMLELIQAVGVANLGFLLDAWHWYTAHGTAGDLAKLTDELVILVHVNDAPAGVDVDEQIDNVRCMPGETGVIDMATFMGTLACIGYTGPVVVEPFSQRIRELSPEAAAAETARSLDKIWPKG